MSNPGGGGAAFGATAKAANRAAGGGRGVATRQPGRKGVLFRTSGGKLPGAKIKGRVPKGVKGAAKSIKGGFLALRGGKRLGVPPAGGSAGAKGGRAKVRSTAKGRKVAGNIGAAQKAANAAAKRRRGR